MNQQLKETPSKCGFADQNGNIHETKEGAYKANLYSEKTRLLKQLSDAIEDLFSRSSKGNERSYYMDNAVYTAVRGHRDVWHSVQAIQDLMSSVLTHPKAVQLFATIAKLDKEISLISAEINAIEHEKYVTQPKKSWWEFWK